jgi:hypothetical protein
MLKRIRIIDQLRQIFPDGNWKYLGTPHQWANQKTEDIVSAVSVHWPSYEMDSTCITRYQLNWPSGPYIDGIVDDRKHYI